MSRFAAIALSALGGMLIGAVIMLSLQETSAEPAIQNQPVESSLTVDVIVSDSTEMASPSTTDEAAPSPSPSDQVLLVWTPGGLPQGLADEVRQLGGIEGVTTIRSDLVHMTSSSDADGKDVDRAADGYVIPLEVMAFDPDTYPAFLTKKDLSSFLTLNPGEILLGSTAAQMRGLGPGGAITLENGSTVAVTAVVDDVLIGGAEAAVSMRGAELVGVNVERYLLVRYGGSRKESESAIRAVIPNGVSVRLRAPGESPVLRHGDAVLPQALIKERFGEFEYRPDGSQGFELDPGWSRANIVTVDVPLLGSVTCHRNLLPALSGAMEELIDRNLSFLIRPAEFAGCFNPRFIANRRSISRHAWGAAVDINMGSNPEGVESAQDPRLIEVMERWGFTSGHDWLIPDPGHFEYLRPPETS